MKEGRDGKKRNTLFLGLYDGLAFVFSSTYRFASLINEYSVKVPCSIDKGAGPRRREPAMHSQSVPELGLHTKVVTAEPVQSLHSVARTPSSLLMGQQLGICPTLLRKGHSALACMLNLP